MPSSIKNLEAIVDAGTFSTKVAAASTIEELVAITPKLFQASFGKLYRKFSDLALKLSHCRTTLSNFEGHKQRGTYPPIILGSFKEPVVQVSKEFADSDKHQDIKSMFQSAVKLNRDQALEACIGLKQEECRFIEQSVGADAVSIEASTTYTRVWEDIRTGFQVGTNKDGGPTYAGFVVVEYNVMNKNHRDLCLKALSLGFTRHQREMNQKMSKLSIKKDTDVEMQDASTTDVKKYIDLQLSRALKAREKTPKNNTSTSMSITATRGLKTNLDCRETKPKFQIGETQQQEEALQALQVRPKTGTRTRKRKREWEQETQDELQLMESQISGKRFKPKDALSYPPAFFDCSRTGRVMFSLLHSSLEFVDSLPSYKAEVFQGPDVSLPKEIRQALALNGKFVLHTKSDIMLVNDAFVAFQKAIRTKWFFRDNYQNKYYVPKFHVRSTWEPPKASPAVERATFAARHALFRQVRMEGKDSRPLNPETNNLRRFLEEKSFLVKITDKNLGLAVVSKSWYLQQCRAHLCKTNNYKAHRHDIFILMDNLRNITNNHFFHGSIEKFLLESHATVPKFHVIPKVHKTPWSSRPIVPSHSWITSRASTVVDHFLQKALKQFHWVLQSTRDFVRKLRASYQQHGNFKNCTLVTGDVKEMYTNIPIDQAVDVCTSALRFVDLEGNSYDGMVQLLNFVLRNNFFEYQDTVYWQHEGIAMGTSCAPTVANLYLAVFETDMLQTALKEGVLFYGRYIDDIFLVFNGKVDTTKRFLDTVDHPHLQISWETSVESLPFLDVQVRIDLGLLRTFVYTKRLNRYMYVPFSSAHPLSVKRALVKGERSRFAAICSNPEDLTWVERKFKANLYRRGYPQSLLKKWFTEPVEACSDRTPDKLFYPSHYNPVWEYIDMREVERCFQMELQGTQVPESLLRRQMLSLKRGGNMYDMYNRSNMTILTADVAR